MSFDIVYYCGPQVIQWDYKDQALGGSEQAVVHLCREWARLGWRPAVYANFSFVGRQDQDGVAWCHYDLFDQDYSQPRLVVLWRGGIYLLDKTRKKYPNAKLVADLHDNAPDHVRLLGDNQCLHDGVLFKSRYHLQYTQLNSGRFLARHKAIVISNGLRVEEFGQGKAEQRDLTRFLYCSSYDRGLDRLLQWFWPELRKHVPTANLDVYYGMAWMPNKERQRINQLLAETPGVTDHGRQPVQVVREAKRRAGFHLYYTDTPAETDCISIRESAYCGCIPLISTCGVFAERAGIHLPGSPSCLQDHVTAAQLVARIVHNPQTRPNLTHAKSQFVSWSWVAGEWLTRLLPEQTIPPETNKCTL